MSMSKSCCFVFVLAAVCLSVILWSLEADAQPTVDETTSCSASTLEEIVNMIRITASNQRENIMEIKEEIKNEIKGCRESNETRLEDVVKELKDEIKDLKKMFASGSGETKNETTLEDAIREIKGEIADMKRLLVAPSISNCTSLLIQKHFNGSDSFSRSWAEYKVGFGDPSSDDYWIGNERLSQLTMTGRYKLRFDLQSRSNTNNWYRAEYGVFRVLSEADNYVLIVSRYSGNAGWDALAYSNGRMFTTYDRDNDATSRNCAVSSGGGFWYGNCAYCGVNNARGREDGFTWERLPGGEQLQSSRMWLHCK